MEEGDYKKIAQNRTHFTHYKSDMRVQADGWNRGLKDVKLIILEMLTVQIERSCHQN